MSTASTILGISILGMLTLVTAFNPALGADEDEENWQVPVVIGKDGWLLYQNPRFGSVIPVPPGLLPLRPPDNGDGQAFSSADGKVRLIVYGAFNVDGNNNVEVRWKDALVEPGRTLTYKRKTESWYLVSGFTQDGVGFYERFTANAKYCSGWSLTYPQAEDQKYGPWVERIAKGYDARLGKGADTLEE